jgi:dihydroxyacid dehydratase/phosphogluconate dehydratase
MLNSTKNKPAHLTRKLRPPEWFAGTSTDTINLRNLMKNQGLPANQFDRCPVIGILKPFSELNHFNADLYDLAERVGHGGLPVIVRVFGISESVFRPAPMLSGNLAATAVEEKVHGAQIDGIVCLVGCDKATPSLRVGAVSVGLPTIMVRGGPVQNGYPGMAEVGNTGLPSKVPHNGITNMFRISKARTSGIACRTVIMDASPEAASGRPPPASGCRRGSTGRAPCCLETGGRTANRLLGTALLRSKAGRRNGLPDRLPGQVGGAGKSLAWRTR